MHDHHVNGMGKCDWVTGELLCWICWMLNEWGCLECDTMRGCGCIKFCVACLHFMNSLSCLSFIQVILYFSDLVNVYG